MALIDEIRDLLLQGEANATAMERAPSAPSEQRPASAGEPGAGSAAPPLRRTRPRRGGSAPPIVPAA
jgi:hypothetical protein